MTDAYIVQDVGAVEYRSRMMSEALDSIGMANRHMEAFFSDGDDRHMDSAIALIQSANRTLGELDAFLCERMRACPTRYCSSRSHRSVR